MNNEFGRIQKKVAMASLKYYPNMCLEGLRDTTDNLSEYS
jgi:hypothetical protein